MATVIHKIKPELATNLGMIPKTENESVNVIENATFRRNLVILTLCFRGLLININRSIINNNMTNMNCVIAAT